jgi:hypothetical protein
VRTTPHQPAANLSLIGPQLCPCEAQPFAHSAKKDAVWSTFRGGSKLLAHVVGSARSRNGAGSNLSVCR